MTKNAYLKDDAVDAVEDETLQFFEPAALLRLSEIAKADRANAFRLAMRELVAGVCIVTTGLGAARAGLTATSVSSLSMAPPSLLVGIQCTSRALKALTAFGTFGVNLLAGHQRDIAERFAGRVGLQGDARFDDSEWTTGHSGVPLLPSALATVECTIERVMEWHTHRVIIGAVSSMQVRGEADALVYWRGGYGVQAECGSLKRNNSASRE
jgi:flavin reductase (DIM6/NTAB) family NADH-FMN oxidoreductase RutF